MKFDLKYLEKLIKIMSESGLTEIQLEDSEQSVVLKREKEVVSGAVPLNLQQNTQAQKELQPEAKDEVKRGNPIKSPMVGTFYTAPSPDTPAFVEVGGLVAKGEVVCIIEAMKLMNEIESDFSGKVVEICVEDGQPVEYGQILMYVE